MSTNNANTTTAGQEPSSQRRGIELKQEYIDPEWKKRWKDAKAKYPTLLIEYAGMVRGLFQSPEAPLSSQDGKVFIVYRTDPSDAGEVHVEGVYSNVPAANEHVMLCFAKEYGNAMGEDCAWSMKGDNSAQELPSGSFAQMVWSFSAHACLELQVKSLGDGSSDGPRRVFVVEEWIEAEPPEDLELSVLGPCP